MHVIGEGVLATHHMPYASRHGCDDLQSFLQELHFAFYFDLRPFVKQESLLAS